MAEDDGKEKQTGPNYLALALKVFAAIIVFNIVATLVFYFFISPHMMKH
ncbi:MAG: hypothetical protein K2P57_01930 [Burkholderiales bacterium]|nr:hypothetical protein [Burkholderiales bacterium]